MDEHRCTRTPKAVSEPAPTAPAGTWRIHLESDSGISELQVELIELAGMVVGTAQSAGHRFRVAGSHQPDRRLTLRITSIDRATAPMDLTMRIDGDTAVGEMDSVDDRVHLAAAIRLPR